MSELLLTDRWFPIPKHVLDLEVQSNLKRAFINQEALNFCITAGRRSFKTERFIKRNAVFVAQTSKGKSFVIGAPTRQQAKDIFWDDLKALSHPIFVKRISETELKITYQSGSSLQVIGLKEFRRKQGSLIHGAFATEYQDCDPEVYTHTFQPMLNDTGGFWFVEGRPLGKNHLYDAYLKGQERKDGWISAHWTSEVVLSKEQIIRAKAEITELDYKREYLADFETLVGRPYYAYSERNHLVKEYNPRKPLIVACDFNATEKPMSWVVGFEDLIGIDLVTFWIKALSVQFTNTYAMCEVLERWLLQKYGYIPTEIHFYGDYAGTQTRSNSQLTDWQIIEDYFRNKTKATTFLKPCLSIRNSIGATNARLKNALNQYRMFIDPVECDALKQDWIRLGWKENGVELEDKDDLRGHACFIGKTLIATLTGMRQIKDIKAGDYVYTSNGIRKVLNSAMTNPSADVYEYIFSNGKKVICTKDHPFFINNNYKPIGLLSSSDIITILDETKMSIRWERTSLFIKVLDMLGLLIRKIEHQDVIIRHHQKEEIPKGYTNKFISTIMEKSQKVITFIIKTAIRLITIYLIWKQSVALNIQQIIPSNYGKTKEKRCLRVAEKILRLLKTNICNGSKNIKKIYRNVLKNNGQRKNPKNIFVRFAGLNMKPKTWMEIRNIAQEIVTLNNGETKSSILKQEVVSIAGTNFKRTNILNKNLVQDDAVTLLSGKHRGKEPVYNLNVEGEHNYFANGILVSNCRALDYFCDYKYPNYNIGGSKII